MTVGVGVMVWVKKEAKLLNEKPQIVNTTKPSRIIISLFIFSLYLWQAEALNRYFETRPASRSGTEALLMVHSQWFILPSFFFDIPYFYTGVS
ncbi:MAG: hypothetical protein MUO77_16375 [Anaerolineales bacterium]|nr:hypothetical protein [Anaerolineales bacterium]